MRSRAAWLTVLVALMPLAAHAEPTPARRHELVHLLRQDCGACHGMTLKGGLGRPLLPDALAGKPAEALVEVVLGGIPGTPMPPWRGLISDDDARWLVGILKDGRVAEEESR